MSPVQSGPHADPNEAVERVRAFLRQRSRMLGIDPEVIHSVQSDPDGKPADLLTSDLHALIEALRKARISADWWMHLSGNTAEAWGRERKTYRLGEKLLPVFKAAQRVEDARPKVPGITGSVRLDDALDGLSEALKAVADATE